MRNRLDKLLLERGLAPSRERAQALILAGRVLVNQQKVEKPGASVDDTALLRVLGDEQRYVSRGGFKLEAALARWQIDLGGRHCADIGTSTGGFTDCMLQHGAASVVAVDTGYGQIAEALRRDPRVTLRERTNARYLKPGELGPGISFVSMDVSFISATLVLPAVLAALGPPRGTSRPSSWSNRNSKRAGNTWARAASYTIRLRTSLRSIAYAQRSMSLALRPSSLRIHRLLGRKGIASFFSTAAFKAVSQLLWSDKDREEWFSLEKTTKKPIVSGISCSAALAGNHYVRLSSKKVARVR